VVNFAKALGVSDLVIGLTIVAPAPRMPEVATSVTPPSRASATSPWAMWWAATPSTFWAAWACRAGVGHRRPGVAPSLMAFDIWVMLAVALACLPIFLSGREIARWEGAVFLGYYAAYVSYLILAAQQHDALQGYSAVMLGFRLAQSGPRQEHGAQAGDQRSWVRRRCFGRRGVAAAAPQPHQEARGSRQGVVQRRAPVVRDRRDDHGAGAVGPQFHLTPLVHAAAGTIHV
jgi:hypothetical protein